MAKASDLRVLFGALAGVGLGGAALLTVVPMMAPSTTAPGPAARDAPPDAGLATEAGPADPAAAPSPRFDTVRMAPDGSGLVAGQAAPGAMVVVLAGDVVATEAVADADGRFVAFLDLAPSAEPRALSLRDDAGSLSEETVVVAPTEGISVEGAREVAEAGPSGGAGAVAAGSTRDLPMDQPVPDLALAGEPGAGPLTRGGAGAGSTGSADDRTLDLGGDASPEGDVLAMDAAGGEPADGASQDGSAPVVAATGPAGGQAPGGVEGPAGGPAAGDLAPSSVAVAVAGPSAAPADAPPDHAGPPAVADPPGGLPESDGASGQAAVLLSDAEGVRVLQPALAPGADAETLATVALDAISYGAEGEVLLSGRASGGGAVRLYLNNRPVGDAPVGADGQWSASITGSDAGRYTLRVDQLDPGGEVVSRIETPFLREAEEELADLAGQAEDAGQTIAMRTVQPGNTLWAIARDRYGEPMMYVQVFEMNRDRIRDPDLIYPGQVFVLPATQGR